MAISELETSVFMQAPVPICVIEGKEHRFVFANPAYRALVGGRDVVGKPMLEALPDLIGQGFDVLLDRVMKTGEAFSGRDMKVSLSLQPDGDRYMTFVYEPKRNQRGEIDGVLVAGHDVTAQVLVRQELADEREKLETMFGVSPVAKALWRGPDLIFEKTNPAYDAIYANRKLVGRPVTEALPELAGQPFLKMLRDVFQTGTPVSGKEVRALVGPDEQGPYIERYYDFLYTRIDRADGTPYGVYCHSADVTDRVQARQRLEQSEASLLALASAIPQQVWTADAAGRVDFVNPQVIAYLGISAETLLGSSWRPYIHPDDVALVTERWARATSNREPYEVEFRLRRADGTYRWHLGRAQAALSADGSVAKWYGTNTDIDETKRFREELEHARELEIQLRREAEAANRSKDEFLAMLGHELRNPLSPITTALELIRLRGNPSMLKEREIIERQVAHLSRLVDDLLDVSRIVTGKIELHRSHLDISAVVASAIEMASPLFERRRSRIHVEVPEGELFVLGDAVRLAQIVSNLLTNAAKFSEPGDPISVAAERDKESIVLRVVDQGIGISSEMLPRVFDLFSQERQSIDRSRGGLGLGLAIVRTLVELHGGRVEVKSAGLGQGSVFSVWLPAASASMESAREATSASGTSMTPPARRVLVVDDNVDAADLLALALEMRGHSVCVAYDAPSALRLVEGFTPDVAVLDIGLPVMDGYELAERLRALDPRTRLVALTGYALLDDEKLRTKAHFDLHMIKPLQLELLTSWIEGDKSDPPRSSFGGPGPSQ